MLLAEACESAASSPHAAGYYKWIKFGVLCSGYWYALRMLPSHAYVVLVSYSTHAALARLCRL